MFGFSQYSHHWERKQFRWSGPVEQGMITSHICYKYGRRRAMVEWNQGMAVPNCRYRQKQYFKVTHGIDLGTNDDTSEESWLMGRHCTNNQQARTIYSSLLWFTYRENTSFNNSSLTSDVGWGCMLRVGQMMMAEAMRRAYGLQNYSSPSTVTRVIEQFMKAEGAYSIEKMVETGIRMYGKGAGQWFTPAETAFILKELDNKNKSSPLRMVVCHSQFQSASVLEYLSTSHHNKQKEITTSHIRRNGSLAGVRGELITHPGLIIILIRIGYNSPQSELLQALLQAMRLDSFAGVLGGRPGRAHYMVGTTSSSFVYLDPHCVKSSTISDNFFSETIFSIPHHKVDTSMGLCFFVRDYPQLLALVEALGNLPNGLLYSHSLAQSPDLVELQENEGFQVLE